MPLPIKSAEDFHHGDPRWGGTTAAERIVLAHYHMESSGFNVELPRMLSTKVWAYARVSQGRWVVDCPWCKSAQNASKVDHRFFCVECGNNAVGNQWIQVEWPDEWQMIEVVLGVRPIPANMNWFPGRGPTAKIHPRETVKDLHNENLENGVN